MSERTLPQIAVEIEHLIFGIEQLVRGLADGATKTALLADLAALREHLA